MAEIVRILHVDDEPELADLVAEFLQREDERFTVVTATSADEGLDRLAECEFDCVVSDYDMPGRTGIEFLEAVRGEYPDLPFVLFTGEGDEVVASDAISAGVTDYIQKRRGTGQYAVLANRVANAVEKRRVQRERKRQLDAMETAREGISILDEDGHFRYVNRAYADLYGYDPADLIGEHWALLYPDEEIEAIGDEVERALAETGHWEGTTTGLRADGSTFVEAHSIATTEHSEVVCTVRDVTERTERERDLEQYEQIVEIAGDGAYILDEDGHYVMVNQKTVERTGYDREELIGTHGSLVLDDEDIERAREAVLGVFRSADRDFVQFEATVIARDGTEYPVEIRTAPIVGDGRIVGAVGTSRDIAERRERERELERYEQMVETAGDAIYALDRDGRFTMVNELFVTRTGYDREALLGSHVSVVLDEADVARGEREIREMLASDDRSVAQYETTAHDADGNAYPVEVRMAPIFEDGEFRGTVGTSRDVTERKERERELERTNERLEEFATLVSHDLRNPLNVASGRIELLAEERDDEDLAVVRRAHERMNELIDDMLTHARQGDAVAGTEPVDLGTLARECWRTVATDDATLEAAGEVTVPADRSRLRQLLENLYRNAIENGGEAVTVRIGALEDGFYVEDDGPGIPADRRERVFDAGYSTAADGTGFGLSIVRQVVDAHDWDVRVTEGSDGGARIEITGVSAD